MRRAIFTILAFVSQNALSWYPEYSNEISAVGSYDTTENQFILIAFNRTDNCGSASLWLDGSLYNHNQVDSSNKTQVKLMVDGVHMWTFPFEILKFDYWLPRPWVLRKKIPADLLRQLRLGRVLTISSSKHKYIWSLAGSNLAIKSAYEVCVE